MWLRYEFRYEGAPYPRFVADVVWGAVVTAMAAVALFHQGLPWQVVATGAGMVVAMVWASIHRRVAREREWRIAQARPRLGRLMSRYGAAPRRTQLAG
jgi:hypothetical protein